MFKLIKQGGVVASVMAAVPAFAADTPMTTVFAAVDLTTVGTWVGTIGVLIIGIALGFKGVDLGKRGIRKA